MPLVEPAAEAFLHMKHLLPPYRDKVNYCLPDTFWHASWHLHPVQIRKPPWQNQGGLFVEFLNSNLLHLGEMLLGFSLDLLLAATAANPHGYRGLLRLIDRLAADWTFAVFGGSELLQTRKDVLFKGSLALLTAEVDFNIDDLALGRDLFPFDRTLGVGRIFGE